MFLLSHPELVRNKVVLGFYFHPFESPINLFSRARSRSTTSFTDRNSLELGCGLAGIVAAKIGARVVILTDIPEQIPHLERNVQLNQSYPNSSLYCLPYLFGETKECLLTTANKYHSEDVEWKHYLKGGGVDVIIGADIAFDHTLHEPIRSSIISLLRTNSPALLVETSNAIFPVLLIKFIALCFKLSLCE
jgi:predicted nicotinamide N-methyase